MYGEGERNRPGDYMCMGKGKRNRPGDYMCMRRERETDQVTTCVWGGKEKQTR